MGYSSEIVWTIAIEQMGLHGDWMGLTGVYGELVVFNGIVFFPSGDLTLGIRSIKSIHKWIIMNVIISLSLSYN